MQGQPISNVFSSSQLTEEHKKALELNCLVGILQNFDQIQLDKNLRFKTICVFKNLLVAHPNFLTPELQVLFTYTCVKVILNKFPLQQAVVNPELQIVLNAIPADYLDQVDQLYTQVESGLPFIIETPYSLLSGIKAEFQMSGKTYEEIHIFVDYSLTFDETYTSSPYDVLHACISMYADQKNWASGYLIGLQDNVSAYAQTLKELFTNRFMSDSAE